jgi:ribonuclease HI
MSNRFVIYTDGGARGNPGPAGIGAVIWDTEVDKKVVEISEYIGIATNNQAEYTALLKALQKAKQLGANNINCYLDSELIVKQLNGEYKVKNLELSKIFVKIWNLICDFQSIKFFHIPREKNKSADALVNQAINKYLKTKK